MVSEPNMVSPSHVTAFQNPDQKKFELLVQKTNNYKENMQWIKEALSHLLRLKCGEDVPLALKTPIRTIEELLEDKPRIQVQPSMVQLEHPLQDEENLNPPLGNFVEHTVCDSLILLEEPSLARPDQQLYFLEKKEDKQLDDHHDSVLLLGNFTEHVVCHQIQGTDIEETYGNPLPQQSPRNKRILVKQCYHKARFKASKRRLWKERLTVAMETRNLEQTIMIRGKSLVPILRTELENRLWNQWYRIGCVSNLLLCKNVDRNRNEWMIDTGWEQGSLAINNGFRLQFSLLLVIYVDLRMLESVRGLKNHVSKQAKISFQDSVEILTEANMDGALGYKLSGKMRNGVTATDLVLAVTQTLRKHGFVGKFVEFCGDGMKYIIDNYLKLFDKCNQIYDNRGGVKRLKDNASHNQILNVFEIVKARNSYVDKQALWLLLKHGDVSPEAATNDLVILELGYSLYGFNRKQAKVNNSMLGRRLFILIDFGVMNNLCSKDSTMRLKLPIGGTSLVSVIMKFGQSSKSNGAFRRFSLGVQEIDFVCDAFGSKKACIVFFDEIDAMGGVGFDEGVGGDNEVQRTHVSVRKLSEGVLTPKEDKREWMYGNYFASTGKQVRLFTKHDWLVKKEFRVTMSYGLVKETWMRVDINQGVEEKELSILHTEEVKRLWLPFIPSINETVFTEKKRVVRPQRANHVWKPGTLWSNKTQKEGLLRAYNGGRVLKMVHQLHILLVQELKSMCLKIREIIVGALWSLLVCLGNNNMVLKTDCFHSEGLRRIFGYENKYSKERARMNNCLGFSSKGSIAKFLKRVEVSLESNNGNKIQSWNVVVTSHVSMRQFSYLACKYQRQQLIIYGPWRQELSDIKERNSVHDMGKEWRMLMQVWKSHDYWVKILSKFQVSRTLFNPKFLGPSLSLSYVDSLLSSNAYNNLISYILRTRCSLGGSIDKVQVLRNSMGKITHGQGKEDERNEHSG